MPSRESETGRIPAGHSLPIIEKLLEGLRELVSRIGLNVNLVGRGDLQDVEVWRILAPRKRRVGIHGGAASIVSAKGRKRPLDTRIGRSSIRRA